MRCDDAVEFISALCDGQRISPEAAEHIGNCERCRARLHDYIFAGVELRRAASLDSVENVPSIEWLLAKAPANTKQQESPTPRWKKGAEAVKIPRFAFVSMLLLIVGLSSGLVVVRARNAQDAQAPVEVLTLKVPNSDGTMQCAMVTDVNSKKASCGGLMVTNDGGAVKIAIRFLGKQGDQITLGIGAQFFPAETEHALTFSRSDTENLPTQDYELVPGQKLDIPIGGLGTAELTGEPLDYLPPLFLSTSERLNPAQDELRVISPLLLRGSETIIDMKGASAMGTGKDGAVWIYTPGVGRLIVSAENFQGAVEGQVNQSRIDFELNGEKYQLLSGAPITRAQDVWVQIDPSFQPPDSAMARGAIGWSLLQNLLGQQQ
jgi:hypothetical protein